MGTTLFTSPICSARSKKARPPRLQGPIKSKYSAFAKRGKRILRTRDKHHKPRKNQNHDGADRRREIGVPSPMPIFAKIAVNPAKAAEPKERVSTFYHLISKFNGFWATGRTLFRRVPNEPYIMPLEAGKIKREKPPCFYSYP
jgi:hypothetical protein